MAALSPIGNRGNEALPVEPQQILGLRPETIESLHGALSEISTELSKGGRKEGLLQGSSEKHVNDVLFELEILLPEAIAAIQGTEGNLAKDAEEVFTPPDDEVIASLKEQKEWKGQVFWEWSVVRPALELISELQTIISESRKQSGQFLKSAQQLVAPLKALEPILMDTRTQILRTYGIVQFFKEQHLEQQKGVEEIVAFARRALELSEQPSDSDDEKR